MSRLVARYENTGDEVLPGQEITDFRGDKWRFCSATRERTPGRSGKVSVRTTNVSSEVCREFYDKVFDLVVMKED